MRKYIDIDYNDLQSIKKAEQRKTKLENQGFNLKHTFVDTIKNTAVLTYENKEDN